MNENNGKVLSAVAAFLAIIAVVMGVVALRTKTPVVSNGPLGGLVHNTQETFDAGIAVNGTEVISSSRGVAPVTLTIGSGTAIDKHLSTTASINASSVAGGAATSSNVTVTGAASGDVVVVGLSGDWGGTSSTMKISGSVTASNTVTMYFVNSSSTALDLSGSTYRLDVWSH